MHQTKKKNPSVPAGAVWCRIQDPGTRGYWWWEAAGFSHSTRYAPSHPFFLSQSASGHPFYTLLQSHYTCEAEPHICSRLAMLLLPGITQPMMKRTGQHVRGQFGDH